MDTPVTLGDHYPEGFDVFVGNIAFTPDVDLVMKGKKTAVKDISLAFISPCNCGIDDGWMIAPSHAYRHMVVSR